MYGIGKNNLKCIFFTTCTCCQRIYFFFIWIGQWKVKIYQTDFHSLSRQIVYQMIYWLLIMFFFFPLKSGIWC